MKIESIFLILLPLLFISPVFAEELKVLESQLNKNSITGVIQNPHNHTVGSIFVRAEFYDKEDGHLVGLRDFYDVSKDPRNLTKSQVLKYMNMQVKHKNFPRQIS